MITKFMYHNIFIKAYRKKYCGENGSKNIKIRSDFYLTLLKVKCIVICISLKSTLFLKKLKILN